MQYMVNMAINSNSIYRGTSFSGYTGFGFAIALVAIDESSSLNAEITDSTALLEVRQLRHHSGPFLAHFSARHHPHTPRVIRSTSLLGAHADRVLTGAWYPML